MFTTPSVQLIADTTRREGGFRAAVYADSRGLATQGFGQHDGVKFGDPDISLATGQARLSSSLVTAATGARALLGSSFDAMDDVRRDAVVDLAFNMGVQTLAQFSPMLLALRAGQWQSAAAHLLVNSSGHLTPYLTQVGARAIEVALRIATGAILPEHKV